MKYFILLDELHLTFSIEIHQPTHVQDTARRTLIRPSFFTELRKAVRGVVRRHPSLAKVRFTLSF